MNVTATALDIRRRGKTIHTPAQWPLVSYFSTSTCSVRSEPCPLLQRGRARARARQDGGPPVGHGHQALGRHAGRHGRRRRRHMTLILMSTET
jgi:hypothetical protein